MLDRIKHGAAIGLAFASIYAVYVLGLFFLRGAAPFEKLGTTLGAVLAAYFVGGISAGVVVGLLQPLGRSRAGAIVVGIIAASFVFLGIGFAIYGSPSAWGTDKWIAWVGCAVFFGGYGGNMFWRDPL